MWRLLKFRKCRDVYAVSREFSRFTLYPVMYHALNIKKQGKRPCSISIRFKIRSEATRY